MLLQHTNYPTKSAQANNNKYAFFAIFILEIVAISELLMFAKTV